MEKSNLLFKYDSFKNKKYCILNIEENIEILNFELNMLENNPELPFLNIEIRQINNKKELVYEIGSKVSFFEIIKNNELSFVNIINSLEEIICNLQAMNEYMLDKKKVILDFKNIFINPNNNMVYFLYLPFEVDSKNDISDDFRCLCIDIFKEILNSKNDLTNNDKRIVDKLSKDKYKLTKAKELIDDYKINKDKESLLDKPNNKRKNPEIKQKAEKDDLESEKIIEDLSIKNNKEYPKKEFESVIEEDYKEFKLLDNDDFEEEEEEDDDLEFKEYEEIKKYEKTLNEKSKNKKLLIMQLIVVMLLGSIGLIISMEDKVIFLCIAVAMAITMLIFTFLLFSNSEKGK